MFFGDSQSDACALTRDKLRLSGWGKTERSEAFKRPNEARESTAGWFGGAVSLPNGAGEYFAF